MAETANDFHHSCGNEQQADIPDHKLSFVYQIHHLTYMLELRSCVF